MKISKITDFLKAYKTYLIISILVLGGIFYFAFGKGDGETELYTVKKMDISQSVMLSGKVQTSSRADLGFAESGRVANIFIKNNQTVGAGAKLAELEIGDLLADLKIKQAGLRVSNVDLDSAKNELDRVTKQEDTKVENAYRKLLSEDLVLRAEGDDYTVDAPTVSGLYNSDKEGTYKVIIDKKSATDQDFQVKTFGLENSIRVINKQSTTLLGTKGLYISFPSTDLDAYKDTTWYIDIPNKSGENYLANYNAYLDAKKNRDLAIETADFKYKKLLSEGDDGSSSIAQAEVQKINAEIRKNTIYAPFSGKVTNIGKEVGENVAVGERVVSMLGEDKLEVVLQVSELDVSRISLDSPIELTFDAFPGEKFTGTLKTINSKETEVDGVPVYEAFVELAPDDRIKTGMSVSGTIVLASKSGVLAVPAYLIEKSGDLSTVKVVLPDGKTESRNLTLGFTGSDQMVEIISGLAEGEQIVAKTTKK